MFKLLNRNKLEKLTKQFLEILGTDQYHETQTYEDEPGTCRVESSTRPPDISDISKVVHDTEVCKASYALIREWCRQKFGINIYQIRHAHLELSLRDRHLELRIKAEDLIKLD
jgi:hypothetical protein